MKEIDNLKIEINEFLFERLPEDTTLKELERISIKILEIIHDEIKYKPDGPVRDRGDIGFLQPVE